jgi:hexosaminidase
MIPMATGLKQEVSAMSYRRYLLATVALVLGLIEVGLADEPSRLRLVPFPKQIDVRQGTFPLGGKLVLEAPAGIARLLGRILGAELKRAGLPAPEVRPLQGRPRWWRLSAKPGAPMPAPPVGDSSTSEKALTREGYWLRAGSDRIDCAAAGDAGLFYGAETLCQLIRANRRPPRAGYRAGGGYGIRTYPPPLGGGGAGLPCVTIRDWPSLRWRCFQDDLTRGPSSTLETLKREVALGAGLKMNLFTYYMEYQYAFKKHPMIGPKHGSLTPEDLRALVDYSQRLHVDVLGNQQSFGHFEHILKHEQYAHLRETPNILCPVKEESYQLLDDLYSEVCPILPFAMFNVCCDETWGLGTGPSKELAEKIGVGGLYVRHIRRIHDLLRDKYRKRMMIWGDIILQHPDQLDQIPKDTVMLTWGYGPRESFEDQIIPFARSGYEFFVCPGISNWSRILPDFGAATTNIRNFVRDGAKHGALGVLNTAWEDDGEALQGYKWHGYAWGAESAWNASTTTPEDFNRRIGAVLFGEPGDHFGRAIELLAQTHRLPGMQGMNNQRFWQHDFPPAQNAAAARTSAQRLLQIVRPAIEHLEACQREATVNADLLDYFLFGARRMELIGKRMLDGLEAAEAYTQAYHSAGKDKEKTLSLVAKAEKLVRANRDAHEQLGREFQRLWLAESKPYALQWTMRRYADTVKRYDELARGLNDVRQRAETGKTLPRPEELGLATRP